MGLQTAMNPDQVLEMTEGALQAVGGVGNAQFGESLIGKQIRLVELQAAVSRAQAAMGVVPPAGQRIERAFVDERSPGLVPLRQLLDKHGLGGLGQAEHDVAQGLSGGQLGIAR